MTPLMTVRDLSVSFGGVRALAEVSMEVRPGQLVGLIGPNGAGKTTFIDAVTGFVRSQGSVSLGGRDLTGLPPHKRVSAGLRRTWQTADLFDDLTLRENLAVAAGPLSPWTAVKGILGMHPAPDRTVDEIIVSLGLERFADAETSGLTLGQRKLAGVARALVGRPRLVCLDEPAAGLDTHESEALGARLRELVNPEMSMVLIDHDMGLVMSVCDYIVVLEFGRIIAQGTPAEIRKDARVIEAYLGSHAEPDPPPDGALPAPAVLSTTGETGDRDD